MSAQDIGELQRQISQLLRIGTVVQVVAGTDTAIVEIGGVQSDPMQWAVQRAGPDASWWAPEPGEQVVIFAPYGDPAQAIILFSLYQDLYAAPSTNPNVRRTTYKDGAVEQYDRSAHAYLLSIPSGGSFTVQVGGSSMVLTDGKLTLNVSQLEHVGDAATFDGTATIKKLLSWLSGVAGNAGGSGGNNAIVGGVNVTGGDVVVDGIGTKSHHHNEHDGPPTSAAQA
ncbi:phage baseplate assembly protein V [Caballeronia fortuita]|uniref:Phage baseplate assembly protein V n=1 Tax=Caballeronia fortuita TaxID=1777138 RepID=A0A158E8E3_9BURK|nr:phage baseplate assembly protein V [Caballeronia fortuita]SAL03118.1 phage baseplate assembly protein V [Caballeronia fortuita]